MAPQSPFDFNPIIIDDVESDSYRCRYSITSPGIIANLFVSIGISSLAFTRTYLQLTDYYAFSSCRQVDIPHRPVYHSRIFYSLAVSNPLVPTEIHGGSWYGADHGYTPTCTHRIYLVPTNSVDLSHRNPVFPLRFRNMASPELTISQKRDWSLLVFGMAKGWQTMMVSEVQALWGAVYLLGGFDSTGKK